VRLRPPPRSSLFPYTTLFRSRGRADAKTRRRFLPTDGQLPGKDLRRRQDPRRLLQARRPPEREGGADLAPHRSPHPAAVRVRIRSEEHTSELQSLTNLVCRLL